MADKDKTTTVSQEEVPRQEPTPTEVADAEVAKQREEDVQKLVEERAETRVVDHGFPLPQTGIYYQIPAGVQTVNGGPFNAGEPAQVAQVQTIGNGRPALVTFRHDGGQEFVVEWNEANAKKFLGI